MKQKESRNSNNNESKASTKLTFFEYNVGFTAFNHGCGLLLLLYFSVLQHF